MIKSELRIILGLHLKGLTKRTMSGIVLFNLDTFFSMCFASEWDYSVLIQCIPEYLGIKGDCFFSHLAKLFLVLVFIQIELL
jgi:hypothetical protein